MRFLALLATVCLLCTSMALAMEHDKTDGQAMQNGKLSHSDAKFVHQAASGGMMEVKLGEMVADKASSDAVKQFGQRMVTDHGKANAELKDLCAKKDVPLSDTLMKKHQAMVDELSKLSGEEFDKAYMKHMVKDHEQDVAEYKMASEKCEDADVKAFAAKTLPTLEEHLKMAKDIHDSMK